MCSEEEALLIKFFYGTMPLRDAGEYPFEIFLSYVRHALWLRKTMDWCKRLPEDLFVHDVLYYRINSEDISDCRTGRISGSGRDQLLVRRACNV